MASNRIFTSISDLFGDIGRARAASTLYRDLSVLSDDSLKSRGLQRSDLPRYAFDKAFNR